jgi:hypothetical protein
MFMLPRPCSYLLVIGSLLVTAVSAVHAEDFIAPYGGNLYVKCTGGSAGATSQFGTGTSSATFKVYLDNLPSSCPTAEVLIGAVTAGQTLPFGIQTYWERTYWAFSTASDQGSVVSFSDSCNNLRMGGKIIQQTSPSTWLMHLNDAAHYTVDKCQADNILIQLRLEAGAANGLLIASQNDPPTTNAGVVVRWTPEMDHAYDKGRFWFKAGSASGMVSVTMLDTGQYEVGAFVITNKSGQKFDLLPSTFSVALLDPKKPPKALDYIPPERVIGKINSSLGWSRFGAGVAAGMATRTETTTSNTSGNVNVNGDGGMANGTYNQTTTSTRQVPDKQRQQQIWEEQRRREQAASNQVQDISQWSLRATTLQPGQEIKGAVFFKRDGSCGSRKGCSLRLTVPVGDTTFEFPVVIKKQ